MNERPQPKEKSKELPELRTEHWQFIVEKGVLSEHIVDFAKAKITGLIADDSYEHYLGTRDWSESWTIREYEDVKHRHIYAFWVVDLESVPNQIAKDLKQIAAVEQYRRFTLDDYLFQLPKTVEKEVRNSGHYINSWAGEPSEEHMIYWDNTENEWVSEHVKREWTQKPGRHRTLKEFGETSNEKEEFDENVILSRYLLTQEEVEDTLHASPEELEEIMRTKVPVEELNRRLMKAIGNKAEKYEHVGGWEKPIPRT